MSDWVKLKPLKGGSNPCRNCPPITSRLSIESRIAVGFGFAGITKGDKEIWTEQGNEEWEDLPLLIKFEVMARKDPEHDWQAVMNGPLHGEIYQRQGINHWVLVERNEGFA